MTLKEVLIELHLFGKNPHFFVRESSSAEEIPVTMVQSVNLTEGPEIKNKLIGYGRCRGGGYDFIDCSHCFECLVKKASYGPLGENGPYRWTFVLENE